MVAPLLAIGALVAVGAGAGALIDRKKPLRGALIGATAGGLGGAGLFAAGAFGGAAAGGAVGGTALGGPFLPGAAAAGGGPGTALGGLFLPGVSSASLAPSAASPLLAPGASVISASGPGASGAALGQPFGDALVSQGIQQGVGALQGQPPPQIQPPQSALRQIAPGGQAQTGIPGPADIGAQVQPASFGGAGSPFPPSPFGFPPPPGILPQDPEQRQLELLLALSGAGQPQALG